jgi:outer membrane lipoprotein SlyB
LGHLKHPHILAPYKNHFFGARKLKTKTLVLAAILATTPICGIAADDTLDAAIGGGVGGAIGAAVGNEVGGRNGAIVGGAIGGAAGAAISTDDDDQHDEHDRDHHYSEKQGKGKFCPPGQAKKGNC